MNESVVMEKMSLKVSDIMEILDVSKSYTYKLIRKLNKELEKKGCFVIAGRIDHAFFYEHFYGTQKRRD